MFSDLCRKLINKWLHIHTRNASFSDTLNYVVLTYSNHISSKRHSIPKTTLIFTGNTLTSNEINIWCKHYAYSTHYFCIQPLFCCFLLRLHIINDKNTCIAICRKILNFRFFFSLRHFVSKLHLIKYNITRTNIL